MNCFVNEFYLRTSLAEGITIEEAMSSKKIQNSIEEWNVKKTNKIDGIEIFNMDIDRWLTK